MIDLKVENSKCSCEASGKGSELGVEVMIAAHSLTEVFAQTSGMSFEAAALMIMQSNTFVHKQTQKDD